MQFNPAEIEFESRGERRIAFIHGQFVSCFALDLPPLAPRKLQRVLPHLVAEHIAGDADALHFCLAGDGIVLACARDILQSVCDEATRRGVSITAIWPDYMRIAPPETGVARLDKKAMTLCRFADGRGFHMHRAAADAMLADTPSISAELTDTPIGAGFATEAFGAQLPIGAMINTAKRPAIVVGVALAIWGAMTLFTSVALNRQAEAIATASETLFRAHAPNVRVVNVEAQTRALLRARGLATASRFLGDMARVFDVVGKLPAIRIEGIAYDSARQGATELSIAAAHFAALEDLQTQLEAIGFDVTRGVSIGEKHGAEEMIIADFTLKRSK